MTVWFVDPEKYIRISLEMVSWPEEEKMIDWLVENAESRNYLHSNSGSIRLRVGAESTTMFLLRWGSQR